VTREPRRRAREPEAEAPPSRFTTLRALSIGSAALGGVAVIAVIAAF